jgi:hypothetical protein
MANGAGDQRAGPSDSFSSDAATMVEMVPVVGPFAKFFKLSPRGKKILLAIVALIFIYPIISLAAALLIIRKSPAQIQKGARSFILSSIGVDEQIGVVDKQIVEDLNRSNKVIDAAIPLRFNTEGSEVSYQKVAARQRIDFEAYLRPTPLVTSNEECAVQHAEPSSTLGTLTVRSLDSSYQYDAVIDSRLNQLFAIGSIDDEEWQKFEDKATTGEPPLQHPLKISFSVKPEIASTPYLRCNKIDVVIYMNIFKRTMVRDSK